MTVAEPSSGPSDFARSLTTSFRPGLMPPEAFRMQIAQWFYAAKDCRINLALSPIKTDFQRGFLSSLISWGEWAQMEVAEHKIDLAPIGISIQDLQAETRILRDTYRSAFDNCLTEPEAEAILKDVFG